MIASSKATQLINYKVKSQTHISKADSVIPRKHKSTGRDSNMERAPLDFPLIWIIHTTGHPPHLKDKPRSDYILLLLYQEILLELRMISWN